jgi:hypothetical protein
MLVLQGHWFAAVIAQQGRYCVHGPALGANNILGGIRVDPQNMTAVSAIGSEVIEPFELAALALPVPDRVFDEVQLRGLSKVGYRENGPENGLEPNILAFSREEVHLQEPVVGLALDLDQIRNLYSGLYSREVVTFTVKPVTGADLL